MRSPCLLVSLSPCLFAAVFALHSALAVTTASAGDLSVVPWLNGEYFGSTNLWGGPLGQGSIGPTGGFTKQSSVVRSGTGAYRANLGAADSFEFFQTFGSTTNGNIGYRQDRDLTQYQRLEGYVRNDSGAPLTFTIELKDYQNSNSHRARRSYTLPAGGTWTNIVVPLDLSSGWMIDGSPDLARTYAVGFLINEDFGPANGSLYLDDFNLVEKGPSIDPATADINTIVERLAHRQFHALWTSRNKTSGIVPNVSTDVTTGALNTTTGVVWMLPSAVNRGWVTQTEADAYMDQLVVSLNANRDDTTYLPTRFLDLLTGAPIGDEESSIDASFIALALHRYKSRPGISPTLHDSIDALQNRFNFAAFARPLGFNLAYNGGGFTPYEYTGYTSENKVISLAAELSNAHHVPIETQWNDDVGRVLEYLVDPDQNHLVYSYGTEYRAAFSQALINLFVDTSNLGSGNYSDRNLARNPWQNFVRYEAEVAAALDLMGREHFLQPDASRGPHPTDPNSTVYNAWNLYHENNFNQPDVFHPWSVALAFLAGAEGSEEALRFLLDNGLGTGLDGPFGLADWAEWPTGAANPTSVSSLTDNWNMTLSTMALMEYLEGSNRASRSFASLPEVAAALDMVFELGDYNGNGVVDAADQTYWRRTFGSRQQLAADANLDGVIDAADYVVWRKLFGAGGSGAIASVPEPATLQLVLPLGFIALWRTMGRPGQSA